MEVMEALIQKWIDRKTSLRLAQKIWRKKGEKRIVLYLEHQIIELCNCINDARKEIKK